MNKFSIITLTLILFSLVHCGCNTESKETQQAASGEEDITIILESWCKSFVEKTDSDYEIIVNFTVTDNDQSQHIIISNHVFPAAFLQHFTA
ncbi:MAG TPA: hypothetical protein ENH59_04510 [Bacteroidetes bacterium]|nr:hypothetical protein [Bacteroidota bacterium]